MNTFELLKPRPGLRVFISGAAAGIGAGIAEAFLEVGASVYIGDVDQSAIDKAKEQYPQLHASVADVGNRADVDRVIDDAQEKSGGLDVLINNAGIAGPTGEVEQIDPDDWDRTVSTNLNSQYYFLWKAVPLLKKTSGSGCIIAMSSVAGRLGYAFRTPYASTK